MRPRVRGQGDSGMARGCVQLLLRRHQRPLRHRGEPQPVRRRPLADLTVFAGQRAQCMVPQPPIHTLASHTWTHPNLVQLPPAELEDELRRPLAWLRQRFERVIPWLSYPYGLASRAVEAAAAAAGYTAALVLEGGWCAPGRVRRYAVPRHGVPRDLSVNGFVLCTSGLCRHDA